MKFGQLIGYNMRNIFLEKSYTNGGGESIPPDPFLKNQNWVYLWINSLKIYTVCFYSTLSCGYRDILKLSYRSLAFTSCKAFFKNKKRSRTSLPTSFSVWFLKKSYLVIFYYVTRFHCLVASTSWDIGQYVYCNCLFTRLWCHKFWN